MPQDSRDEDSSRLAKTLAKVFSLPQTASRIVDVLAGTRRKLGVSQLVERVRRSERSVRHSLGMLLRKGILEREVTVTATKKLAYVYSLSPMDSIIQTARDEFSKTVGRLEELAGVSGSDSSQGKA